MDRNNSSDISDVRFQKVLRCPNGSKVLSGDNGSREGLFYLNAIFITHSIQSRTIHVTFAYIIIFCLLYIYTLGQLLNLNTLVGPECFIWPKCFDSTLYCMSINALVGPKCFNST